MKARASATASINATRNVVDRFRFGKAIGLDVALKARSGGCSQRKFTLDGFWRHATRDRAAKVMRPGIEAITT